MSSVKIHSILHVAQKFPVCEIYFSQSGQSSIRSQFLYFGNTLPFTFQNCVITFAHVNISSKRFLRMLLHRCGLHYGAVRTDNPFFPFHNTRTLVIHLHLSVVLGRDSSSPSFHARLQDRCSPACLFFRWQHRWRGCKCPR